jgi:hypothetical protein
MRRKRPGKVRVLEGTKHRWLKNLNFSLVSSFAHLALLLLLVCVGAGAAASDGGPTGTPLPDKKLLLFILDRLQK